MEDSPRAPRGLVRFSKIKIYSSRMKIFLVGTSTLRDEYRLVKIDRTDLSNFNVSEDAATYTEAEISNMMRMVNDGNLSTGGLKLIHEVHGVVGFIRLLTGVYMGMITAPKQIGSIAGHVIYAAGEIEYLHLQSCRTTREGSGEADGHYRELLQFNDVSDCFFSYSYDITHTLQHNCSAVDVHRHHDRFTWNSYLLSELSDRVSPQWLLPIVHGYFTQVSLTLMSRPVLMSVIARRSRHFAGVRYLKRGLNEEGNVANEVETEQILQCLDRGLLPVAGQLTSFVQVRGSIPLFWGQDSQIMVPKPPISLVRADPFYNTAILHFRDLFTRYGAPVLVLNLVKSLEKVPRETLLKEEYERCIMLLNERLPPDLRVVYIPWDFLRAQKNKQDDSVALLSAIAEATLSKTGFFLTGDAVYSVQVGRKDRVVGAVQCGVVRTNCVDSLDRTNAAQFCIGRMALIHQLHALGIDQSDMDDAVLGLMELFEDMGNQLALQYGGSQLAHTMKNFQAKSWTSGLQAHSRELLTSVRRYYHNSFTDAEKQAAMNLFLGVYVPSDECEVLWEMETDYLHHMKAGPVPELLLPTSWWEPALAEHSRHSASRQFPRTDWALPVCHASTSITSFDDVLSAPYHTPFHFSEATRQNAPASALASSSSSVYTRPVSFSVSFPTLPKITVKTSSKGLAIPQVPSSATSSPDDAQTRRKRRSLRYYQHYLAKQSSLLLPPAAQARLMPRERSQYASYLKTAVVTPAVSDASKQLYRSVYLTSNPQEEKLVY